MEDFNISAISAMKARNIAAQFGVIEKAETSDEEVMKAHQVGDAHPNGKWVWTEYKPGRFDWRPLKGRGGVDRTPQGKKEGEKPEDKKEPSASGKTADVSKFVDDFIKDWRSREWNPSDAQLKKMKELLINNEATAKKIMSATFPSASGSSAFHPSSKEIKISDSDFLIFEAYSSEDTTSQNPSYYGRMKYTYSVIHKSAGLKKTLTTQTYHSGSKLYSSSEVKKRVKQDALLQFLHF